MAVDKMSSVGAADLYKNTQGIDKKPGMDGNDKVSFGDMLKKTATEAISTIRGGEKASAQAVVGDASLTDVVEAVTQAELTLQTVVAMRDKMLSAYQEIMRMPI